MQDNKTYKAILKQIFQKSYEERDQSQNEVVINFLTKVLKKYTSDQCKWLSLLCSFFGDLSSQQKRNHLQIENNSLLIYSSTANESQFQVINIEKQSDLLKLPKEGFLVIITKKNLNTCLAMNEVTIQEAVKELKLFEYLEDILKKRFYHILRNIDILHFTFNQVVYLQSQSILEECGVYMVKKGDFTFLKREKETHKNVELCTFSQGYLFGTEEQVQFTNDLGNLQRKSQQRRTFTVKCQSSGGILYRVNLDFFNSFMRKSCQSLLRSNNQRLNRFLEQRFMKAEMSLTRNAQFITQPFKRSFSIQLARSSQSPFSLNFQSKRLAKQVNDNDINSKKSLLPLLNIKSQFPSRKRLLSKEQTKKLNMEYQEQKIIMMKQYKCEVIKQAKKIASIQQCRGEVLLNLMKTSYQFQKQRYKKSIL